MAKRYKLFAVAFAIELPPKPHPPELVATIKRLRVAMREGKRFTGTLIDESHLADAAQCAEDLVQILRRARASTKQR